MLTNDKIQQIATQFGITLDANKLEQFANYVYDLGWSDGEEFMAEQIQSSDDQLVLCATDPVQQPHQQEKL